MTELVFILDSSGFMHGMESDTIGGFNAMIEKQKKVEGHAYISTVLFGNECTVLHDRVGLHKVSPMTDKDYSPCGSTALLDAIGGAIHHIGNLQPEPMCFQVAYISLILVIIFSLISYPK